MKRFEPSAAAPIIVVLLLVACAAPGNSSGSPEPSGSPSPTGGGTGAIEHPTGADEPVLVVDSAGGFVPVEFAATRMPALALYGDGRVIMQGVQTLEYPGPALPALIERTMTPDGIQAVLKAVESTNLFGASRELRGAQNIVADAADTLFIVNAGGREVTVSIYGLGMVMPDMELPPGMPAGEIEAHGALTALNDRLMTLDAWLPADAWEAEGWQPYEPEGFRLYVRDVTEEPVDGALPEHVMEWPTDDDPAVFGEDEPFLGDGTRCGAVTGEQAEAWLEALAQATQITRWTDDGDRRFGVTVRPLLPHDEPACPELAAA